MAEQHQNLRIGHILSREVPFQGMRTKPDARMLGDGELKLSSNIRFENGLPHVRMGSSALTTSAQTDFTPSLGGRCFSGRFECGLNGTNCAFVAWNGTAGAGYAGVYRIDTGTQTEITATTGKFGNTRFTLNGGPIFMQNVRDEESGLDYLVMQFANWTDYPRVYNIATGTTAIHRPITAPQDGGLNQTVATWPTYFVVGGSGTMPSYGHTGTGTHLNIASNGSAPDINVRLTRDSTADATPATATATWAATKDLSADRMLCMIVDQGSYPFWFTYLKIEIHDTVAGYSTVYDGQDTTGVYEPVYSPVDGTTSRIAVAFSLDHIAPASRDVVDAIRFTWNHTTAKPSATINLDILCLAGSGKVPGLSKHCVTLSSSDSRAESISIYPNAQTSDLIGSIGGRPLADVRIPVQPWFFYSYRLFYLNTDASQLAQGVDTLRIYRQDYSETQYSLVAKVTTGSWNGSAWVYTSGSAGTRLTYTDNTAPNSRNLWITPPRRNHITLPIGGAMANSNGRLFVAAQSPNASSGSGGLTEVMGSEFRFPFRFRYGLLTQDAAQPSRATYPGENVQCLTPTSLTGSNVASVYVHTDRSVNVLDGLDAFSLSLRKRVAPLGCLSPWAVCEDKGRIFWVDQLTQVQVLDLSGINNLSRRDVDDKLQLIKQSGTGGSQVKYTALAFADNKLYLGLSIGAASPDVNDSCLVYDTIIRKWVSLDVPPSGITFEGFLRDVNPTSTRIPLLVLSSDQRAYRYEMPGVTTDLGSNIAVQIQARDIMASEIWKEECGIVIHRMRVECDDAASGSISATVTYRPSGSTRASAISVDVTTGRAFRYDDPSTFVMKDSTGTTEAGGGTVVANGNAANILVTASLPGGTNIYDLAFEMERRDGVADVG